MNLSSCDIHFQSIDVDYHIAQPSVTKPIISALSSYSKQSSLHEDQNSRGTHNHHHHSQFKADVPVLRIYGSTIDGMSVMTNVHGFKPYMYFEAPANALIKDGKAECYQI